MSHSNSLICTAVQSNVRQFVYVVHKKKLSRVPLLQSLSMSSFLHGIYIEGGNKPTHVSFSSYDAHRIYIEGGNKPTPHPPLAHSSPTP